MHLPIPFSFIHLHRCFLCRLACTLSNDSLRSLDSLYQLNQVTSKDTTLGEHGNSSCYNRPDLIETNSLVVGGNSNLSIIGRLRRRQKPQTRF